MSSRVLLRANSKAPAPSKSSAASSVRSLFKLISTTPAANAPNGAGERGSLVQLKAPRSKVGLTLPKLNVEKKQKPAPVSLVPDSPRSPTNLSFNVVGPDGGLIVNPTANRDSLIVIQETTPSTDAKTATP